MDRVQASFREKRPHKQEILFLQDNAKPHTAKVTKEKLFQFGWEILEHPPYSPDLSSTDYKAFRSLQNFLNGKRYVTEEETVAAIQQWINGKTQGFWVKGIAALPHRWAQVLEYEGEYFPDD